MAKIIYGIRSGGLGHYSRSKLIIDHLISKNHDVCVFTAGRVYDIMSDKYNVKKIKFLSRNLNGNYPKNQKSKIKSNSEIIKKLFNKNKKLKQFFKEFDPDLVISDLEIFTARLAILNKTPIIYVGNAYSLSTDAIKEIKGGKFILNKIRLLSFNFLSPNNIHAKSYITASFFDIKKIYNKKIKIIPSLIRQEVIEAINSKQKNHILVYQTKYRKTKIDKKLSNILKSIPNENFIIYGFDVALKDKNLQFKKTSVDNSFFEDLKSCKAIIANGGFGLMSEGIFLKKPILSVPLRGQVEQLMNAIQVEKLGYGKYSKKLNSDDVKSFLYNLDIYKKNLKKYKQKDNSVAFKVIDKEIENILEESS